MEHPPDYRAPGSPEQPQEPNLEQAPPAGSGVSPDLPTARRISPGYYPSVSVVVLNYNGLKHLQTCFDALLALDYPRDRLELMMVDNGSTDGSQAFVRERFPAVRVVETGSNLGFAAGNNYGAERASGDYVALLNNDTRVERGWLKELVGGLANAKPGTVCTSSLMLDWQGEKIDFQAGALNFHGFGFQPSYGLPYRADIEPRDLLFACGGSMLIQRDVFLAVGGFDPEYFAFFEDVDLGWRLWLLGYRVTLTPSAITYHRHHGTAGAIPNHRVQVLYERNALYTIYKNYEEENLASILPAALMLLGQRAVRFMELGGVDLQEYEVGGSPSAEPAENVHRLAVASLLAVDEFRANLGKLNPRRQWLQSHRARSDHDLLELFGQPGRVHLVNHETDGPYTAAHYSTLREFGIEGLWSDLPKEVMLISPDVLPVGEIPASGSGIRAWALGKGLEERGHRVRMTMPKGALQGREKMVPEQYALNAWTPETLQSMIDAWHPDVVVSCGWPNLNWTPRSNVPVALDLTGPHLLERAYQGYRDPRSNAEEKLRGIRRADFFTCIGERQRYYFTAWLAQAGVPPGDLDNALAVIPYSLDPQQPGHAWPDSWNGEEVHFVYGGIFLPWQNPAPALLEVASALGEEGRGVLEVIGGKHPFHAVDTGGFGPLLDRLSTMPRVQMSGLLPHDELVRRYTRAHVAVDVMMPNPERELAFPSRTVHYLWCGLPVIHAAFSEVAPFIRDWEAGWVVPHDDAEALKDVVRSVLADPNEARRRGQNAQRLARERFSWDVTIARLDEFVRNPFIRTERMRAQEMEKEETRGKAGAAAGAYLMPAAAPLPQELRRAARKRRSLGSQIAARSTELMRALAPVAGSRSRPLTGRGGPRFLLPELISGHSHGQRFMCPHDGLSGIRIEVETFGRKNTCRLLLHLRTHPGATVDVYTLEVPAYHLRAEQALVFRFAPIKDSAGQWFYFVADSPDGVPGDAVTFRAQPVGSDSSLGQRYEDGLPAGGSLVLGLEFEGAAT